jgi:3-oxoacyl-[acyl-carrier-protein] synthase III
MMTKKKLAILGTGGFTFPVVSTEELMRFLGSPKDAAWLREKFGILRHSLNFNCATGKKITNETTLDYAERAARLALEQSGVSAEQIDHLCLATCTPAEVHFEYDVFELHRRLGLKQDARIDFKSGGCGVLASVFDLARAYALSHTFPDWHVLIVAVNDTCSFYDVSHRYRYRADRTPYDDAWLSPLIFSDGAAALVLGSGEHLDLRKTVVLIDGAHSLARYRGGGTALPTSEATLDAHAYVVDMRDVAARFIPATECVVSRLLGDEFSIADIQRWYIHQASLRLVEKFVAHFGISPERVPHNAERFGNTVSASTLLLLDEDRRSGRLPEEGPVAFVIVGAGMMAGGALFL